MVGGVGVVLGFQAESAMKRIGRAGAAFEGSVEKVAGVELDAGLDGVDLEDAA